MANQWKMQFNPDLKKQAKEVIFSSKLDSNNLLHPRVTFSNNNITGCSHQNHLRVFLDSNLNFNTHIDQKIKKCNKMVGIIRRLLVNILRSALLKIYKSFIRPHVDYGDILYHKPKNEDFQNKMERHSDNWWNTRNIYRTTLR